MSELAVWITTETVSRLAANNNSFDGEGLCLAQRWASGPGSKGAVRGAFTSIDQGVSARVARQARWIASSPHGRSGGGTRFLLACSNAYASAISFGSAHWPPVNAMPYGTGLALNPSGNAGVGAFGTIPNGTTMIG